MKQETPLIYIYIEWPDSAHQKITPSQMWHVRSAHYLLSVRRVHIIWYWMCVPAWARVHVSTDRNPSHTESLIGTTSSLGALGDKAKGFSSGLTPALTSYSPSGKGSAEIIFLSKQHGVTLGACGDYCICYLLLHRHVLQLAVHT
jgi:hypothetical protein